MSHVHCTQAALYFVAMKQSGWYCDIQSASGWCTELDVFEANRGAIQVTIHTQRTSLRDQTTHCHSDGLSCLHGTQPL